VSVRFRRISQLFEPGQAIHFALIAVFCLLLAVSAQRGLDRDPGDRRAYLSYGIAAVVFALAFGGVALERLSEPDESSLSRVPTRFASSLGPVAALLGVALLGCLNFGGNRFRPLGLVLWGGGLCVCLCYLYLSDGPTAPGGWLSSFFAGKSVPISRNSLLLVIAVAVGAVLRVHQLDVVPADIGWDLPYIYADARAILRGEYRIFFPANLGREGLFFYLIALVARFGTLSHFLIKLASVLVGIATIPALYLAARKLFNPSVALGAAFLLAVNRWHIVLSRSGFRVILLPLFTILLLYALVRALQSYRLFDFALTGLVLGLGLYTYFSFLFAPFAVAAGLALLVLSARRLHWRSLLPLLAIMLAVAVVVAAPLGRFVVENPELYLQRILLQVQLLQGDAHRTPLSLSLLLGNMRTSLLMFNVYGDGNSRFNVPFFRHFGFVSALLLVLGSVHACRRWRQASNGILLAMSFIFILPSGLVALPREMPNLFRASGAIGPALVLAALPLPVLGKRLRDLSASFPEWDLLVRMKMSSLDKVYESVWRLGRRGLLLLAPTLIILLLLVVEGRETTRFYFRDFVNVLPDKQNVSTAREMARQIETYGDLSSSYIKVWPHWFDGRALLMYLREVDERKWSPYFYFSDLVPDQPPLSSVTERALFILHPADLEGLAVLRDAFPRHATTPHLFPDGTSAFLLVHVER
jgi:hypothetical protein